MLAGWHIPAILQIACIIALINDLSICAGNIYGFSVN
ncbi:putative exported domain protein, partial [Yersinia pestis PY-103]